MRRRCLCRFDVNGTYNVAELKPEVDYSDGTLTVRTPNVETGIASLLDVTDYRYEWDLRLNDDVPMELHVDVGTGRTDLKLGSLSLTRLDIAGGAGALTVDLTGAWQVRAWTTTKNPALRFLLIGLSFFLQNVWLHLRWLYTQVPRRGRRWLDTKRFTLARFARFIVSAVERRHGCIREITAPAVPIP